MKGAQLYTLIIAIAGVLHGPLTAQFARWTRASRLLRQITDTVKVLWRFRHGAGN